MRVLPLVAALCISTGCTVDKSASEPAKETSLVKPASNELSELKTYPVVEERNRILKEHENSYQLNGTKYIVKSSPLIKGTQVLNPKMSESGVLKGSFVVQSQQGFDFEKELFTVEEIADNTYRLISVSKNADLGKLYKLLQRHEQINSVEIEIDFSRRLTLEEF